jgi:hopanoid biosynthesis associated RND transporter like protein HpnN
VLTGILLYYTVTQFGIDTDSDTMLSEKLRFRRNYNIFKAAFPQYDDALLLVIDAETPELAQEAGKGLAARMQLEPNLFSTVYFPGGDSFFQNHGLLYLSPDELNDLADNLARIQPFLGTLSRDQSLRGLFSMLTSAVNAVKEGENLDLNKVFEEVQKATNGAIKGQQYMLSWQNLMLGGESNTDSKRVFILAKPRLDYSKLLPGETAITGLRKLIEELPLVKENLVRVRATGDAALEHEEFLGVSRGAGLAGILALITVTIVLFVGLRSPRLVIATLITLIMGLIWTASFATAAVGNLNLISIAFAVLYIGLSVDYAIHFCLRYKELIDQGDTRPAALQQTAQDVGSSLVLCSVTTAIGFYAFIPTVFEGVAELGLISGTGMFISLIANLTVLPALLNLMPLTSDATSSGQVTNRFGAMLLSLPSRRARTISVAALLLGLGAIPLLPYITFENNPMNLRDPKSESVVTFTELLAQGKSPWTLTVLAEDPEAANIYANQLGNLDPVARSITLDSFVPTEQDEKLAIIEEISLIVGPDLLNPNPLAPPGTTEQIAALGAFAKSLGDLVDTDPEASLVTSARELHNTLNRFLADLKAQEPSAQLRILTSLEQSLLGSLPSHLQTLDSLLKADHVTKDGLPENLVRNWVSPSGRYRVAVFPREDLNDDEARRRFVMAVQAVAPDAIGFPVIFIEAGDAVVRAFQQALLLALVAVTVLLLILLRPKTDALLVILPLLLAGGLTGAASVLFNVPFNFANVIALPLLLGIGVDSGIHMVHRLRTAPPSSGELLQTSTARAVLFSSLTTICSFGNLAVSPHRGMASMGELLTIGIGLTLMCTLPALAGLSKKEIP